MEKIPRVGIAVFVKRNGKIILMHRKGSHGEGTWSTPGGHLEFKESWEECANREVLEELGIKIKKIKFLGTTNDIFESEDKHYITIFLSAEIESGEPKILEPNKCSEIIWADWKKLPQPLFIPLDNFKNSGLSP